MIASALWFVLVSAAGPSLPGWAEALLVAASTGVLGMGLSDIAGGLTDRISGGDDDDDDGSDDELGGDDGLGGDLGDDEFGDWDDDGDGEMDGWDDDEDLDDFGGGGGNSDLEPRLEDLENEVASISSTMGTVRSENEAINETVEDIEDNIRKLLEIYEMVTRGVNPFVDDVSGGGGGGMGGSFGLFDDADEEGDFDDIDPDIAGADADSFFDDDFDDGGFDDDDFADDDFDDGDLDAGPAEDATTMEDGGSSGSTGSGDAGGDDGDGKTFDELKSEYESGEGEWDEDAEVDPGGDEPPAAAEPAPEPMAADSSEAAESNADAGDLDADPSTAGGMEFDTESVTAEPEPDAEATEATADTLGAIDEGSDDGASSDRSDGKPYLESIPGGFGSELLVIEWLTYLRGRSSTSEALRAIKYYETIGWIGDAAADSLQRYLSGLADDEIETPVPGGTQLTIEHHTNSLHYIGKLGGTHVDVERLEWTGPMGESGRVEPRGQHGIQR